MTIWILTRLVYYPFWVIRSVLFDAPALIQVDYRWENIFQRPIVPRIIVLMLCCLLVLHLFWTWVLIRVAVHSVRSGEMDDIREDSDSEDKDENKVANKKTD